MPKGRYPRTTKTFEEKTKGRTCKYCPSPLVVGSNWNLSEAKAGIYKCRPCGSLNRSQYQTPENREKYRLKVTLRPVESRACKDCAAPLQIGINWSEALRVARSYRCVGCRTLANKTSVAVRRNKTRYEIDPSANIDKIKAIYRMAATLTKVTGRKYHVDHIQSLSQGGLHHENNLVAMIAPLNQKKHAQSWPWLNWFNETSE